jgi:dTDP-L-rhamnose 4-epimerase
MKVLITGGAGFIGQNLAKHLLAEGNKVRILDNFSPQIHGDKQILPQFLAENTELIVGDVRDRELFSNALRDQEVVVHLAAETGTGQSMYRVEHYEDVNLKGTAILCDYLMNSKSSRVQKVIVASSRAIYGEGKYCCPEHGMVYPSMRSVSSLKKRVYEPLCPICKTEVTVLATDEQSKTEPSSFYGLTKLMQEKMILLFAEVLGISAYALRYQNVYGPGQSLNNPYTGILAIFSNQARDNLPIYIFEDGLESRDFVHIDDVIQATCDCITHQPHLVEAFNVGSGERISVNQVVQYIKEYFGSSSEVQITGQFREGDIRHNFADISKIRSMLQFNPTWTFQHGIGDFLKWVDTQDSNTNMYEKSLLELKERGLLHG